MRKLKLVRISSNDKAIYGILIVMENEVMIFSCKTIENKAKTFPDGVYPIKWEHSPRFSRNLWELYDINGRGDIKIHVANKYDQLEGCIGVGTGYSDINSDSITDIINSRVTLDQFHLSMGDTLQTTIEVVTL